MGRFVHEAVAFDPATGIAYLTEDDGQAGLYRFVPAKPGDLSRGGRLEMLALAETLEADLSGGQAPGAVHRIRWVPIEDPDPEDPRLASVFAQGRAQGGASFRRLEGACFSPDGRWLFLNVQNPGFTCAITGPWERGPL